MWNLVIPALASLAGGWLAGEGERKAGEAQADAANQNAQLQREVYADQRALAAPGYLTGGAASNALAAVFGIGPQDYAAALEGSGPGGNALAPTNFGAGQPVGGHTGGKDNWTTMATAAPAGYDYDKFWNDNPDLQTDKNGWLKADVRALFNNNRNAYLNWFQNQSPDRKIGLLDGYQAGPNGVPVKAQAPAAAPGGGSGGNALADPMAAFNASPYAKIATSGFRGIDVPEINGAYARGGKVLSGAQSKALDERGKARLGGAFTDYTNGLRSLAGMNQTASSQIGSAAGAYGANAGNALANAGIARGNALSSAYKGIGQGVSGAIDGIVKYGQDNWGWA